MLEIHTVFSTFDRHSSVTHTTEYILYFDWLLVMWWYGGVSLLKATTLKLCCAVGPSGPISRQCPTVSQSAPQNAVCLHLVCFYCSGITLRWLVLVHYQFVFEATIP